MLRPAASAQGNLSGQAGGIGPAATMLAAIAWLAIPIMLLMVPETRGQSLDTSH